MQQNVSEIQFTPINQNNGHIAFVRCVLNNQIVLNHIALHILRNGQGYRLNYPALRGLQCFYPIDKKLGEFITNEVSLAWEKFQNQNENQ